MGASLASPTHLLLLVLACLLLFGAKRLPEIGRSLGTGMREFKTSVTGTEGVSALGESDDGPQRSPAATIAEPRPTQPETPRPSDH
jgi:sec-independent protein translocase protein TatA